MSESGSVEDFPNCGGAMTRVPTPPPWRRVWRWFNYGARPRGQVDYECPACGHGVSMTSYYVVCGHWTSRGRRLRGRISHLRSRRTLEPTPRFYAIVAVVGIGGGRLVSWVTGRPQARWQVPVAALAASWLFMESSVFWGQPPGSDREA